MKITALLHSIVQDVGALRRRVWKLKMKTVGTFRLGCRRPVEGDVTTVEEDGGKVSYTE